MSKERARPLPRTPVALSVLNLLNERPMHPYEMRVLIRQRRHDRAFRIRESSIYDTVGRLADRGFIEPVEVNREGRRPERTVYAITEAGRDELLAWLWDLASEPPDALAPDGEAGGPDLIVRRLPAGIRAPVSRLPPDLRDRGGVRPGDAPGRGHLAA